MRDECNSHAQPTTLEETEVGTVSFVCETVIQSYTIFPNPIQCCMFWSEINVQNSCAPQNNIVRAGKWDNNSSFSNVLD